jgi:hypothetical protein
MAPIVVTLMVVVHACAPPRARAFSLTALGWMLFVAALTMTVHFIELTVVAVSMRRLVQPERPKGHVVPYGLDASFTKGEGSWRPLLRDPRHRTRRLGLPFPQSGRGVP